LRSLLLDTAGKQEYLVIVSGERRVGRGWGSQSGSREHPGDRISPAASCSVHALQAGQHSMQTAFSGLGSFQDQKLNPPEVNTHKSPYLK